MGWMDKGRYKQMCSKGHRSIGEREGGCYLPSEGLVGIRLATKLNPSPPFPPSKISLISSSDSKDAELLLLLLLLSWPVVEASVGAILRQPSNISTRTCGNMSIECM